MRKTKSETPCQDPGHSWVHAPSLPYYRRPADQEPTWVCKTRPPLPGQCLLYQHHFRLQGQRIEPLVQGDAAGKPLREVGGGGGGSQGPVSTDHTLLSLAFLTIPFVCSLSLLLQMTSPTYPLKIHQASGLILVRASHLIHIETQT